MQEFIPLPSPGSCVWFYRNRFQHSHTSTSFGYRAFRHGKKHESVSTVIQTLNCRKLGRRRRQINDPGEENSERSMVKLLMWTLEVGM